MFEVEMEKCKKIYDDPHDEREIEYRDAFGDWRVTKYPNWNPMTRYRAKEFKLLPQHKLFLKTIGCPERAIPDYTKYLMAYRFGIGKREADFIVDEWLKICEE